MKWVLVLAAAGAAGLGAGGLLGEDAKPVKLPKLAAAAVRVGGGTTRHARAVAPARPLTSSRFARRVVSAHELTQARGELAQISRERPRAAREAAERQGLILPFHRHNVAVVGQAVVGQVRGRLAAGADQSPVYLGTITDLGTLGGTSSHAAGIDENGDVVGDAMLDPAANQQSGGADQAFFAPAPRYGMTGLGSLRSQDDTGTPITGNSSAKALNPSGSEIVGWSETNSPTDPTDNPQSYHATTWKLTPQGWTGTDLGTLYAPANSGENGTGCLGSTAANATAISWASAVNDSGSVVGIADWLLESCPGAGSSPDFIFPYYAHAFRWVGSGPMEDLGTLDNTTDTSHDCAWSEAIGENPAGEVVGLSGKEAWGGWGTFTNGCSGTQSTDLHLIGHAFMLPAGSGAGSMVDLGEPAGGTGDNNFSEAMAVNDDGQIAVNALDNSGTTHGYLYDHGTYTDVGSLGGSTWVYGIDSGGDLVGQSLDAQGTARAIAYIGGSLIDLNSTLASGSGWFLQRAKAINDNGQIVGTGTINGQQHAFVLQLSPPGPDITSGPDQVTNSRSPTFTFTSDYAGDVYECSLDGAAYSKCTSPQTYSGLTDGSHDFKVRVHNPDEIPSAAADWRWTINTQAPVVIIDSAPSGSNNPPDATISFHGSEPNLSFTCQLDGGMPVGCGSPQNFAGLAPGDHVLSITATDSLGNTSKTPTVVTWNVGTASGDGSGGSGGGSGGSGGSPSPPPVSTSCPAPAQSSASGGLLFLVGRSGTCLTRGTYEHVAVWKASGPVTLNGISITPDPGSFVALSASTVMTSGGATIQLGSLPSVHLNQISWSADAGGVLSVLGNVQSWLVDDMGGLKVPSIWPSVDLSADNGGSAKITLQVTLPDWFSALPGTPTAVSGSFVVSASNNNGVSFGGKLTVGEAWFGLLAVKDFELGYDSNADTWVGQLGLVLGVPVPGAVIQTPELLGSITLGPPPTPSLFGCCLRAFSLALQHLNIEIPDTPLFLQQVGIAATQDVASVNGRQQSYLTLAGTLGASLLEDLPVINVPPVSVVGTGSLSFSDPWVLTFSGQANLLKYPISNAKIVYTNGVGVTLSGGIGLTLAGYGLSATILPNSFFTGSQFNIGATGTMSIPAFGSQAATAVFSTNGFAACTELHTVLGDVAVGFGVHFPSFSTSTLAGSCDLSAFSDTASAAAIHSAGDTYFLHLPAFRGVRLIAVRGTSSAPRVTLTGPDGVSLASPADGGGTRTAVGYVMPNPAQNTTYVLLARNPRGTYSIVSPDPIASVATATSLPRVRVRVATRALPGGRRRLTYSQVPAPGQTLQLYELGSSGTGRLLLTTTRSHGSVTFRPATGIGSRREILAVTIANGLPRDKRALAPYVVADGPPPRVKGLSAHGNRLVWKRAARADAYVVTFTTSYDGTPSLTTGALSTAIPSGATSASIVPLDSTGRAGAVTTVRLSAQRTRRPSTHRRKHSRRS